MVGCAATAERTNFPVIRHEKPEEAAAEEEADVAAAIEEAEADAAEQPLETSDGLLFSTKIHNDWRISYTQVEALELKSYLGRVKKLDKCMEPVRSALLPPRHRASAEERHKRHQVQGGDRCRSPTISLRRMVGNQ